MDESPTAIAEAKPNTSAVELRAGARQEFLSLIDRMVDTMIPAARTIPTLGLVRHVRLVGVTAG